jgi:Fe-S cluster assembly protein SufD
MICIDNIFKLVNDSYVIDKPCDDYLIINKASKIVIRDGLNIKLIDNVIEGKVELNIERNAAVKYLKINSKNATLTVNSEGELSYVEIVLDDTQSNLEINLNKEYSAFNAKVLSIAKNVESKFYQMVKHNSPNTNSVISNFGIAMNGANISFDTEGKIFNKMSKSTCSQLSRGVVMDDESSVTSLPILLIDEFDVVANHGSSIGKMSDDDLFYLMSRGLTKNEAFLLMLDGIINPFVQAIENEEIKGQVLDKISKMIG